MTNNKYMYTQESCETEIKLDCSNTSCYVWNIKMINEFCGKTKWLAADFPFAHDNRRKQIGALFLKPFKSIFGYLGNLILLETSL